MEELINVLNQMFDEPLKIGIVEYPEDPKYLYFKEDNDTYQKAVGLCCDLLITAGGQCNWDNIRTLRDNGFRVFPGDKDSFGWLIGCIQKKGVDKLMLTYG